MFKPLPGGKTVITGIYFQVGVYACPYCKALRVEGTDFPRSVKNTIEGDVLKELAPAASLCWQHLTSAQDGSSSARLRGRERGCGLFLTLGSTTFFSQLPKWKEAVSRNTLLFVIQRTEIVQVSAALDAETRCGVELGACTCAVRGLAGSMARPRKRTCP